MENLESPIIASRNEAHLTGIVFYGSTHNAHRVECEKSFAGLSEAVIDSNNCHVLRRLHRNICELFVPYSSTQSGFAGRYLSTLLIYRILSTTIIPLRVL